MSQKPKVGYPEWYLQEAYEQYLDREFDPRDFVYEYHNIAQPGDSIEDVEEKLETRTRTRETSSTSSHSPSSSGGEKSKEDYRNEIKDRMNEI